MISKQMIYAFQRKNKSQQFSKNDVSRAAGAPGGTKAGSTVLPSRTAR
jgi:hypothetical protein